ncbi:MAG: hypothetical protein ACOCP8_01735 [archaeon]
MSLSCKNCKICNLIQRYVETNEKGQIKLFNDASDNPHKLYKLASCGLLSKTLMSVTYNKYNNYYYDRSKRHFDNYYRYCYVFSELISDKEFNLLISKLKTQKYKHRIVFAIKDFDLSRKYIDELNSYLVFSELALTYT